MFSGSCPIRSKGLNDIKCQVKELILLGRLNFSKKLLLYVVLEKKNVMVGTVIGEIYLSSFH